jgi:hypothetical protein
MIMNSTNATMRKSTTTFPLLFDERTISARETPADGPRARVDTGRDRAREVYPDSATRKRITVVAAMAGITVGYRS